MPESGRQKQKNTRVFSSIRHKSTETESCESTANVNAELLYDNWANLLAGRKTSIKELMVTRILFSGILLWLELSK